MKIFPLLLAAATVIPAAAEIPPPGDISPDVAEHPGKLYVLNRDCEAFMLEAYEAIRERSYGSVIEMIDGDDGFVYFNYIVSEYPCESSIKAERVGETIVIKGPQALYEEYDYDTDETYMVYLVPLQQYIDENQRGYYIADESMEFVFNVKPDGTLVSADPTVMLGVCTYGYAQYLGGDGYIWSGYGDRDITISKVEGTLVTPPEGLEPQKWVWEDDYETTMVNLIFDNKDIYIQGMDRELPETWVKGTQTAENQIEFTSGQYLGPSFSDLFFHFFCGADFVEIDDPESEEPRTEASLAPTSIFRYDAAARKMHTVNGYVINSSPTQLYPLYFYRDLVIEVQERNPNCPPAAPYDLEYISDDWGNRVWVQIPNTDTDGNLLDEDNLYYELFLDGDPYELDIEYPGIEEHPTWVPYKFQNMDIFVAGKDHTVYFYAEGAETFGMRSVYVNEEGNVIYSTITGDGNDVAVDTVKADVEQIEWYDLMGRRISRPEKGIVIRSMRYNDGNVKTQKVVLK